MGAKTELEIIQILHSHSHDSQQYHEYGDVQVQILQNLLKYSNSKSPI